jgi:dihydroflavonol-4-reductase
MRAFVTGASGFVGSAVVRSLLQRGASVKVLVRPTSDLRNLASLDVDLIRGDLRDLQPLEDVIRGCDVIFHVAALYSTSPEDARRLYDVNVDGTKQVLQLARSASIPRLVHTSTIGTIGQPKDGSLATEAYPFDQWSGASHYAKSKFLGEVEALQANGEGLAVIVVNPAAPVGPGDIKPSSTGQRLIDYLQGRRPSYVRGGINFVPLQDVADGHVLAAEKGQPGERYILGHRDGNLTLEGFCALMERVSGHPAAHVLGRYGQAEHVGLARRTLHGLRWVWQRRPPVNNQPLALTCDPGKAIEELGLPQTSLEDAFAAAVAWFRQNGYA